MSPWKVGVELELLAPPGLSRRDLAQAYSRLIGGAVESYFHPQSEPSLADGVDIFENLTLGFRVLDSKKGWAGSFVDDLTLQMDLNRNAPPVSDWFRIVSDDKRFLNLINRLSPNPVDGPTTLLPLANLFGTELVDSGHGMWQVQDQNRASVALAAPLPGERHRPCEVVTPPMTVHRKAILKRLLGLASSMGFTLAKESATHIHFDAIALLSARNTANLVCYLHAYGDILKRLVGCNPLCRRLGPWPMSLIKTVSSPGFRSLPWEKAKVLLIDCHLKKYCDFNIKNYVLNLKDKATFEVRILPGMLDLEQLLNCIALFEGVLNRCVSNQDIDYSEPIGWERSVVFDMLNGLPISKESQSYWVNLIRSR